jgi:hypothetical protein
VEVIFCETWVRTEENKFIIGVAPTRNSAKQLDNVVQSMVTTAGLGFQRPIDAPSHLLHSGEEEAEIRGGSSEPNEDVER